MSEPSMRIRNIRYRHPLPSQQLNDIFNDVYNDLARLLGCERYNGDVLYTGVLESTYGSISDYAADRIGYNSGGASSIILPTGGLVGKCASICHIEGWVSKFISAER